MPEPATVDQALAWARDLGVERLDAQLLLAHTLSRPRSWVIAHGDAALPADDTLMSLLRRRAAGEPLAYLVGKREFHGLALEVGPAVLVPRPDTETLVGWAVELIAQRDRPRVIDLGTGSGAIALALKAAAPAAQVHATDRSEAALAVAAANGRRLGLAVSWHLGDWWRALADDAPGFDVAVSNPPYIAAGDPHLAALRFEPHEALVPQGDAGDGLADLERVIAGSLERLRPGGWLLLEHGFEQAGAVRERLQARGFAGVSTRVDLSGQPRASGGQRPAATA